MKIAIILASMMMSAVSFAGTRVEHDYGAALRGLELKNACITDTEVKSIKPVRTCTKLVPIQRGSGGEEGSWTEWVCQKWEVTNIAYPRAYTVNQCAKIVDRGEAGHYCERYEDVTKFLPEVIKVRVVTEYGEASDWPGVTKNFRFPACK